MNMAVTVSLPELVWDDFEALWKMSHGSVKYSFFEMSSVLSGSSLSCRY